HVTARERDEFACVRDERIHDEQSGRRPAFLAPAFEQTAKLTRGGIGQQRRRICNGRSAPLGRKRSADAHGQLLRHGFELAIQPRSQRLRRRRHAICSATIASARASSAGNTSAVGTPPWASAGLPPPRPPNSWARVLTITSARAPRSRATSPAAAITAFLPPSIALTRIRITSEALSRAASASS